METGKVLSTQELIDSLLYSDDILPSEKIELKMCKTEGEAYIVIKRIAERWGLSVMESPENKELMEKSFKDLIVKGETKVNLKYE